MITKVQNYLEEELSWRQTKDPAYPYQTEINGDKLVIRLNDFPDNQLYTLMFNDEETASFDDWPTCWRN